MKRNTWTIWIALFFSYLFTFYCGEPTPPSCQKNSDCPEGQICTGGECSNTSAVEKKAGEKADKPEKTDSKEKNNDSTNTGGKETQPDETTQPDEIVQSDEGNVEPSAEMPDAPPDRTELTDEIEPTDRTTDGTESIDDGGSSAEKSGCSPPTFTWNGRCVTPKEFCTSKFPTPQQIHIQKPYSVVFDKNGTPLFCKTSPGSYYTSKRGYQPCDNDGDGWITAEAYRAMNSTDKNIQNNARCNLRKIEAVVYHPDTPSAKPQIQFLKNPLSLIETERNDGLAKNIELPVYPEYTQSLPKSPSSACTADTDCNTQQGELCYRGQCVKGRRFKPAELNSFTKACVKNIDLNDNSVDDPSENPNGTTKPTELSPLLPLGYFVELNYGYYQKDYDIAGRKVPVYHIVERSRLKSPAKGGLALLCGEDSNGKKPDYWKYCALKDDQRCKTSGGTVKKGLSHCWLNGIQHATRSLFKCAIFDEKKDANTYFFHPYNFGLKKRYTRTSCRFTASLPGKNQREGDVQFECKVEKNPPKLSQTEVGWACVSFHPYAKPKDYLAGCIDECTESKNLPDALKPCGVNEVCNLESGSYGRGVFRCNTGSSGICKYSQNYCKGGKWTNCPKNNSASPEVCDGKDNDCDGKIDEDPNDNNKPITRPCYSGNSGCKKEANGKYSCTSPCKSGVQFCYVGTWEKECIGEVVASSEVCNGRDDDCDGKIDNSCKIFKKVYYTPLDLVPTKTELKIGNPKVGKDLVCKTPQCPEGTVIVGISASTGRNNANWIRSLTYICAEPKIKEILIPGKKNPLRFELSYKLVFIKKYSRTCNSSSSMGGGVTTQCPSGYVLVGFSGNKGAYLDRLYLWCSKAELVKTGNSYQITLSKPKKFTYSYVGGSGGSPFKEQLCPSNSAITAITVVFNDAKHSEISGLIAKCSQLKLAGYREFGTIPATIRSFSSCRNTKCPDGYGAIGIKIKYKKNASDHWIRSITSICAEIKVKRSPNSNPPYRLEFLEKNTGECRSSYCCTNYTSEETRCPAGHLLVGFSGMSGAYIDQLTIWCSKVKMTGGSSSYQLSLSTPQKYGTVGVKGGGPFPKKLCPPNSVLTGLLTVTDGIPNSQEIKGVTAFCHKLIRR